MPNVCLTCVCVCVLYVCVCVLRSYAGFSKKGYAPYNPRKHNQDALIMAEDASTGSLFLAVMDGHGEVGEKVAQVGARDQTAKNSNNFLLFFLVLINLVLFWVLSSCQEHQHTPTPTEEQIEAVLTGSWYGSGRRSLRWVRKTTTAAALRFFFVALDLAFSG